MGREGEGEEGGGMERDWILDWEESVANYHLENYFFLWWGYMVVCTRGETECSLKTGGRAKGNSSIALNICQAIARKKRLFFFVKLSCSLGWSNF